MQMKTRSCKAKGRMLQNETARLLREKYGLGEDIRPAIMGETGVDIKLSPYACTIIPFGIECKNTEKLNIWSAIKQAESNSHRVPLVVFKRNRSDIYCSLKFIELLRLLK